MESEVKAWLDQAEKDLELAKYDLKGEYYEDACFHSQQAAEKALKAVYIKKFKDLLKIHDVKLLAQKVSAPPEIIEIGDQLNPFYTITRYPDIEEPTVTEEDTKDAIKKAERVLEWVKRII